jgi:hypothetical protein
VDHVPDPLLLRKYGSAGNRTRSLWICTGTLTTRPQRRSEFSFNVTSFILQHTDPMNVETSVMALLNGQKEIFKPSLPLPSTTTLINMAKALSRQPTIYREQAILP